MTFTAADAGIELLDARRRVLRAEVSALAKLFTAAGESAIQQELGRAERSQRPVLGLLLAERVLQRALATESPDAMSDFVFRLAAHLKASVGLKGVGNDDRVVLATAARLLFATSPAMRRQVDETDDILDRLPAARNPSDAWQRQFGMDRPTFSTDVEILAAVFRPSQPARFSPQDTGAPTHNARASSEASQQVPPWLVLPGEIPSPKTPATAGSRNWAGDCPSTGSSVDLQRAWTDFESGRYQMARQHLSPLFSSAGQSWVPSASSDGQRSWNWLRLVWILADHSEGRHADRRRALLSAIDLSRRATPSDTTLTDTLAIEALRDYEGDTAYIKHNWAVHSARAAFLLGKEVLDVYDNDRKAELRAAWSDTFGKTVEGIRQTHQMLTSLHSDYKQKLQLLVQATTQDPITPRKLVAPLKGINDFLDIGEQEIATEALALMNRVSVHFSQPEVTVVESQSIISEVAHLGGRIAASESLVLQDTLGEAVASVLMQCQTRLDELSLGSRPIISVSIVTARLPLSSQTREPFRLEVALQNIGNATAELIETTLTSDHLRFGDQSRVVDRIAPGASRVVEFMATCESAIGTSVGIDADLIWRDSLEQSFQARVTLLVEDQQAPTWHADDRNPFKLQTIGDPRRLFGREADLDALERITAGGGSAVITGLKRVGKSSLARGFLDSMKGNGWATEYLTLGQVLTANPSALQVVVALIEAIDDAIHGLDHEILTPEPPAQLDEQNFTRSGGRWLRQVGKALSRDEIHVLVALDDFDELPESLYVGDQASALFLFLRSMIDHPWLSLVFIGSEALPMIIGEQAHKLNQLTMHAVSNFRDADATGALLASPTATRLEWQREAIERVHFVTNGNPYYSTILGREVWQRLRELDRSYVAVGDIEEAVIRTSRLPSTSDYVHLWSDSRQGIDSRSVSAIQSAAVLRAVAVASGESYSFVPRESTIEAALAWLPESTLAEISQRATTLVGRGVLVNDEASIRLSIPLASSWLRSAGGSELQQIFDAERHVAASRSAYTSLEIVQLTRGVTFCGDPVSETYLAGWLEQFSVDSRRYAFLLAKRLLTEGFYSNAKLSQEIMPTLSRKIQGTRSWSVALKDRNGFLRNAYILDHGLSGSSSHAIATTLTKLLKIKKSNVLSADEFVEVSREVVEPSIIIVADDFAGSGETLRRSTQDLLSKLESRQGPWRENLHIVVGAGISACARIWTRRDVEVHIDSVQAVRVSHRLKAWDEDAQIFDDGEERSRAQDEIESIGRSLSPNTPNGFGDLGLLIATEQNCPNNSLPIIWKQGSHLGREWIPLLQRRL